MFESCEKNANWTLSWGVYSSLPDPDLGELEVPEPPLRHKVGPEELDLFMESCVHNESEVEGETEHSQDASSTRPSLIGAWSGSYEYDWVIQTDGLVSLSIIEHEDDRFKGSGIDAVGAFTVDGTMVANKIIFTKSYTTEFASWKYIGVVDTEMGKIDGRWGPPDTEGDVTSVSAVDGGGPFNHPGEEIDRNSLGERGSLEQAPPCDIEITIEGPSGTPAPGEEMGEKVVDVDNGVSEASSSLSTAPTGVLVIGGTFTLARKPVDYFLYRPSDAEFQESRPKALWKMVRNWARRRYHSHRLTWDTLRERRDRRIQFMALFTKREAQGVFYIPDEAATWAQIIQQTHPNDLRMWRAIAHFKKKRMISHLYVSLISHLLLLN